LSASRIGRKRKSGERQSAAASGCCACSTHEKAEKFSSTPADLARHRGIAWNRASDIDCQGWGQKRT
jgi:hypothetical protein